ncbi:MAG: hypothetical protein HC915_12815 [Anaerolineae bacterium]|nr:hypothetical protein [Anaerolineae bacterium]
MPLDQRLQHAPHRLPEVLRVALLPVVKGGRIVEGKTFHKAPPVAGSGLFQGAQVGWGAGVLPGQMRLLFKSQGIDLQREGRVAPQQVLLAGYPLIAQHLVDGPQRVTQVSGGAAFVRIRKEHRTQGLARVGALAEQQIGEQRQGFAAL